MSLPSSVIFYKDGIEVRYEFTNCGWICNPDTVKRGIIRTLIDCSGDFDWDDWDIAEAYGFKISKEELFSE